MAQKITYFVFCKTYREEAISGIYFMIREKQNQRVPEFSGEYEECRKWCALIPGAQPFLHDSAFLLPF